MDAEWSVELGREDPTLAVPWTSPDGTVSFVDLGDRPDLIARLPEVVEFPELAPVLRALNDRESCCRTAKCDAWLDTLMDIDDEPYEAAFKCASYIDLFFTGAKKLAPFEEHERTAREIVGQLRALPDQRARVEIAIRRCYFERGTNVEEGLYWTVYVFGYGDSIEDSRKSWADSLFTLTTVLLDPGGLAAVMGCE